MTLKSLAPTVLGIKYSEKKLPAAPTTRKWRNHRRNAYTEPKRHAAQKYFSISISIFLYSAQYFKLLQRTSWWQCTSQSRSVITN